MTFRHRLLKDPKALIRVGLVFLILASAWRWWFSHPSADVSARWIDGVNGLLYGVSIGCLLLGLNRNRRLRSTTEDEPCA
jgi:hypothetical protein